MNKKKKAKVEKLVLQILKRVDKDAKIKINIDEIITIDIESPNSGILIGEYGKTLSALEHIIRIMTHKELTEFMPLFVDVGGYRKSQKEKLEKMALKIAEKVLKTKRAEVLKPMSAYERRIVHIAISQIDGVETESVGEDQEKRIIIRTKR